MGCASRVGGVRSLERTRDQAPRTARGFRVPAGGCRRRPRNAPGSWVGLACPQRCGVAGIQQRGGGGQRQCLVSGPPPVCFGARLGRVPTRAERGREVPAGRGPFRPQPRGGSLSSPGPRAPGLAWWPRVQIGVHGSSGSGAHLLAVSCRLRKAAEELGRWVVRAAGCSVPPKVESRRGFAQGHWVHGEPRRPHGSWGVVGVSLRS